jgi:hypothetical protein
MKHKADISTTGGFGRISIIVNDRGNYRRSLVGLTPEGWRKGLRPLGREDYPSSKPASDNFRKTQCRIPSQKWADSADRGNDRTSGESTVSWTIEERGQARFHKFDDSSKHKSKNDPVSFYSCRQFCSCPSLKKPNSSTAFKGRFATTSISITYKQQNSTRGNKV